MAIVWDVGTGNSAPLTLATTGVSVNVVASVVGSIFIVTGYSSDRSNPITVSDSNSNTWTTLNPEMNDATNSVRMQSWWATINTTSLISITVKGAGAVSAFWGITVDQFTGQNASPVDQVASTPLGATTGADASSEFITLGANDCLVWSVIVDSATSSDFIGGIVATTSSDDGNNDISEFGILTGQLGSVVNASYISGGVYNIYIASIKPTAAATVPSLPRKVGRAFPFRPGSAARRFR
jgi:hypothetical protein